MCAPVVELMYSFFWYYVCLQKNYGGEHSSAADFTDWNWEGFGKKK